MLQIEHNIFLRIELQGIQTRLSMFGMACLKLKWYEIEIFLRGLVNISMYESNLFAVLTILYWHYPKQVFENVEMLVKHSIWICELTLLL